MTQSFIDVDDMMQSFGEIFVALAGMHARTRHEVKDLSQRILDYLVPYTKNNVYSWEAQQFAMRFATKAVLRDDKTREENKGYPASQSEVFEKFTTWFETGLSVGAEMNKKLAPQGLVIGRNLGGPKVSK